MVEKVTRRQALALAVGQSAASRPPRLAPREQLVNVPEYEAQARLKIGADLEMMQQELVAAAAAAGRKTYASIDKTAIRTHFI